MRRVELLIKPVSCDCNLDCTYCFYKKTRDIYPGKTHRMNDEVLKNLVQVIMKYSNGGACLFSWQGGEPLVAELDFFYKAVELEARYGTSGQHISNTIQTNGILIDRKWIEFFKKYNVFLGISLDGPYEIHNFYRRYTSGQGSFNQVIERVNLLKREKVEFNILSTIGEETAKNPDQILRFFISKGLFYLQFIPAVDRKRDMLSNFSIKPGTYGEFLCQLFDSWWNNGQPLVSVRFFDNIIERLIGLEPGTCIIKKSCGEYLVVEHNGDIYPCDFFVHPNFKMGNIFEEPFEEIVYKVKEKFGKWKEMSPQDCRNCQWNFICNNGCLWFRWINRGDLQDKDYFCPAYKKFFQHSIERFSILSISIRNKYLNSAQQLQNSRFL